MLFNFSDRVLGQVFVYLGRHRQTSHAERIGIRKALDFGGIQRGHRMGIVEPDILVELCRQAGPEIVAREFSFGPVDHADRPLKPLLAETRSARIDRRARADPA